MPVDGERLHRLLGGPELAGLRQRLRKRYAAAETPVDGFTLGQLTAAERDALTGLLGRRRSNQRSLRLSHDKLDQALRAAELADNLRQALECLDGPIVDTRTARERADRAWAEVFAAPTHAALAETLAERRTQGLLKRLAGRDVDTARRLIAQAEAVLARLPAPGIARARLAADALGDAHGLDAGQPVATLVRRTLDGARQFERVRDLWAQYGVLVNELAKPVAVLNLQASGAGVADRLITTAREAGAPLHLSLRLLARNPPLWRPGQTVHVCENPEVLAAAADALAADSAPLVCIDGQLSAAPRTLLDQLARAGCDFVYHGDFDWPGLTIANGIMARYGARPWRYRAADYTPTDGPPLTGEPVEARWDDALAARMKATGVAVHEESQLDRLLADLAPGVAPQ
ncbi:TIGR02679 family protein [Salinisphaera sp. RV14]|uniref:TIGR02679 family protein n=1 Tax=unclassified Salinisphaera TaxID=2649847 RepID=UPI003F8276C7